MSNYENEALAARKTLSEALGVEGKTADVLAIQAARQIQQVKMMNDPSAETLDQMVREAHLTVSIARQQLALTERLLAGIPPRVVGHPMGAVMAGLARASVYLASVEKLLGPEQDYIGQWPATDPEAIER